MADQKADTLKRWSREQFKEEVARELGIDLKELAFPAQDINRLEQNLHSDGETAENP
jgi:DNA-directed RNA polymerase specialized sigma subunit